MTTSFGYWVRRRRKALDLTQQALASQAGCSLAAVKKIELRGHAPSGTMAAFDARLECAGTALARCLAERFAADEPASGGSRMREWRLFCAIGQRRLAWTLSDHTTC